MASRVFYNRIETRYVPLIYLGISSRSREEYPLSAIRYLRSHRELYGEEVFYRDGFLKRSDFAFFV